MFLFGNSLFYSFSDCPEWTSANSYNSPVDVSPQPDPQCDSHARSYVNPYAPDPIPPPPSIYSQQCSPLVASHPYHESRLYDNVPSVVVVDPIGGHTYEAVEDYTATYESSMTFDTNNINSHQPCSGNVLDACLLPPPEHESTMFEAGNNNYACHYSNYYQHQPTMDDILKNEHGDYNTTIPITTSTSLPYLTSL